MASNTCTNPGGNFGCRNINQIVTNSFALSGGNRNTGKWHKQPICTDYLQKLRFMHIHRIDPVIINDRTQSRAGKCNLSMWIFSLKKPGMITGSKGIFTEIIQSQKRSKTNTAHTTFQCTFLCIQAIWKNSFMSGQMKCFILI